MQTINESLIGALQDIAPACYWELDEEEGDGRPRRRILFNYNTVPDIFGDNAPVFEKYLIQVHYFCPKGENSLAARQKIKLALFALSEEWPDEILVQRVSKKAPEEQHYCFEFTYLIPIEWSGEDGKIID
ncbi:MAG: hypothetical protein K2K90_05210 [Lachnospiraceae bacterium]|nr:hypothetical protein [Lachnospiraceae bacterium]